MSDGPDPGHAHVEADRAPGVGHLLVVDDLLHEARRHAAVLLRPGDGEPVALGELLVEVLRELALHLDPELGLAVEVRVPAGLQFRVEELLDFGAKRFFFGGESKVHGAPSSGYR